MTRRSVPGTSQRAASAVVYLVAGLQCHIPPEGMAPRHGNAQVLVWVLSYDGINSPEPLAITAAAAALSISGKCTAPSLGCTIRILSASR